LDHLLIRIGIWFLELGGGVIVFPKPVSLLIAHRLKKLEQEGVQEQEQQNIKTTRKKERKEKKDRLTRSTSKQKYKRNQP
jgi:hypothetical protein